MTTRKEIIAAAQRYWRRDTWNNEYFDAAGYADFVLASRDAEIAELQRNLANEQARDIHSCHHNCAREGCVNRRLRAELAAAIAACKVKDEAMLFARNNLPKIGHIPDCLDPYLEKAIAIQPDDSALKAWLGRQPCAYIASAKKLVGEDLK